MVAIPATPECVFPRESNCISIYMLTCSRLYEEDLQITIESRTESLQALRELGPPDLVHLMKVPIKGASKQVQIC